MSAVARVSTAVALIPFLLGHAPALYAQGVELAPFVGYRLGFDFYHDRHGPVGSEGAPALGLAFDVPLSDGFQVEGLFTHQQGDIVVPIQPIGAAALSQVSIDHWQAGGLQELRDGHVRPFLTGTLGITRYAAAADNEFRFSIAAGGGVKLFAASHLGARLDGRVFTTFIDAHTSTVACANGRCFVALHVQAAWQAEFTTAFFVKLP